RCSGTRRRRRPGSWERARGAWRPVAAVLDLADEPSRGDRPAGQQAELRDRALDLTDRIAGRGVDACAGGGGGARKVALVPLRRGDDQVRPRPPDLPEVEAGVAPGEDDSPTDAEAVEDRLRGGVEDRDAPRR